ncbi:MAG: hypothetical protein Q4D77_04015, partial [Peptostreptococcaceae bacterium]|nr:hypothetical protein [Peptostreptococcaceae bacterium]
MKKTHSVSSLKKWLLSFFLLAIIILIPQHSLQGYADEPKVFELDLGGKVHKLEAKANGETKQIENNITWDEKSKTLSFSNYNGTYISFKGSQPFYKDNITFHFTGENRLVGRTGNKPEDFGASLITYFPTTLTGAPGSKLVIAPTDPSQTHVNHGISGESSVSIGGDLNLDIKGISNSALWGISSLGTLRIQGNSNVSIDIFSKENRGVYGFAHGLSGNSIIISTTGRIQVRSASNGAYAFGIVADNVSIHNGDIDIEIPSATEGTHYAKAIRLNNDEGVLTLGGNMVSIVGSVENKIYGGSDPYSASVHVRYLRKGLLADHAEIRFASGDNGKLSTTPAYTIPKGSKWDSNYLAIPTPIPNKGYIFDRWEPALPSDGSTIDKNMTFTALFKKDENYSSTAEIRFIAGVNGELKGNTTFKVEKGTKWEDAKITIPGGYPAKGYHFAGWSPRLPYRNDLIEESMVYTAQFKTRIQYPTPVYIYFYEGSHGKLNGKDHFEGDSGTAWAAIVSEVPKVIPEVGYKFIGWNTPIPDPHSGVTSSLSFDAQYEEDPGSVPIQIDFSSTDGGTLDGALYNTISKGTKWKDSGIKVPNITSDPGYKFAGWKPDLPGPEDVLLESTGFVAQFVKDDVKPQQVTVTFAAGEHGKLNGTTTHTVNKDTLWSGIKVPTPQADPGYKFDKWTPALPQATDKITGSKTYTANFVKEDLKPQQVTVTFAAGEHGKL